jgi:hypothetical protein
MKKNSLRPKVECEVCGEKDTKILHRHHLVERTELHTDNSDWNLAILCPSCHSKTHDGTIRMIGVFPSTKNMSGRLLVFEKNGVCNVPALKDAQPYYVPKTKAMRIIGKQK